MDSPTSASNDKTHRLQGPLRGHPARGPFAVTKPNASEWEELLDWLNRGLRAHTPPSAARLQSEFPTSLDSPDLELHSVVQVAGQFASHAFARIIDITADGRSLPFAMIGLVYTDPAFRKRGLAAQCIERCVAMLRERGVPLVGLWSDLHSLYARLGFEPAGQSFVFHLTHEDCERALPDSRKPFEIREPRETDWRALEILYSAKPSRALRKPGDLRRLAAAPETQVTVAFSAGVIRGYAAIGRGDDFQGIVHEWAGSPDAVIACLAELSSVAPIGWLTGPSPEEAISLVTRAGCLPAESHFALLQVLDPGQIWFETQKNEPFAEDVVWQTCESGFLLRTPRLEIELSHAETLRLLFGPRHRESTRIDWAPTREMGRPWPLFVWGFDSN